MPHVQLPESATARIKPVSLMVACGELPALPAALTGYAGEDQAKAVLGAWEEAVSVYADCVSKQVGLTEWIKAE